MYVKRHIDIELAEWKTARKRKPLLLRGARQVGKSSAVKELAKKFDYFVEVNFEKDKTAGLLQSLFERGLSVQQICSELSLIYNTPVIPGKTLLFLDEIQASLPAISSLRYFYEDYPELHVIAAGSLLEFALEELPSFGVGRIRSLFMYPFSFDEYLRAMGQNMLADALQQATPESPLPETAHRLCLQQFLYFMAIGGMPEVVATYAEGGSLLDCQIVLDDLIVSLLDDFSKYKTRISTSLLREIFTSVIEQSGQKFTYSQASPGSNHVQIKKSMDVLEMAGIIYPVTHTAANGLPLAAETNTKYRKYLIFDTGIMQRFLKLDLSKMLLTERLEQINKGALAEVFVGLELLKAAPFNSPLQLYYWQREERWSKAEVDYVVQHDTDIIPVEVKSGSTGSMQSLHRFLLEKRAPYGIRCSLENFGALPDIKIYPVYAASKIVLV